MRKLEFEVLGKAQGLDRSRQTANGIRFDSAKNRNNKAYICMEAIEAARQEGIELPIRPYRHGYTVKLEINVEPPKSYTKRKLNEIAQGEWSPLSKPDIDNVLKLYLDALNGRIIEDDRFVSSVQVYRVYAEKNMVRCVVEWSEVDE